MIVQSEFIPPANCMGRGLRIAAGLVFTGLLIFAPLNFGSTRAGGIEVITWGCAAATLLWAAGRLCGGPRAVLPTVAVACVTLLTLAALPWITGLTQPTLVSEFTQTHFARVAARWPYSIVWHTPASALAFTLALAAAALPLIDLARSRGWALTFSLTLILTAVAVALVALMQNYTHATGIYWRNDGRMPGNFSGTFYHHTAAGAYYNTAWPLAAALAWFTRDRPALVATAGLATIVLLAAHGSHVSRFPQFAAFLVAPLLWFKLRVRGNGRRWLLALGAIATIVLIVAVAGRAATIGERWRQLLAVDPFVSATVVPLPESAWPALMRDDLFVHHPTYNGWLGDRGEGWRTAWRAIATRPLTGHGPGNWIGAASHHTDDPFVRTFFQFLQFTHQDLLQFAVEWGVPATLGWWGLLLGAVVVGLRSPMQSNSVNAALGIAGACALTAVLLQGQLDFPLQMPAIAFNVIVLAALGWAAGSRPVLAAS